LRVARVATQTASGRPFLTPLWFMVDGDALVIATGAGCGTSRNAVRNPQIVLLLGGGGRGGAGRLLGVRGTATVRRGMPPCRVLSEGGLQVLPQPPRAGRRTPARSALAAAAALPGAGAGRSRASPRRARPSRVRDRDGPRLRPAPRGPPAAARGAGHTEGRLARARGARRRPSVRQAQGLGEGAAGPASGRRAWSSRKKPLSSGIGVASANASNRPSVASCRAARMNPLQAVRASAPPTLMRRTPRA